MIKKWHNCVESLQILFSLYYDADPEGTLREAYRYVLPSQKEFVLN